MEKAEFDAFADEYHSLHAKNISATGESPEFFAEYKLRDIAVALSRRHSEPKRILDFGSGIGSSVPWARKYLPQAELTCVDVSERCLKVAAIRFPGLARFVHFDGATLPFQGAEFDLVYAMCVFHHIDHSEHVGLLGEIGRVLGATGTLVVFEHNPYNPLTVRAVNTCEFDIKARLITARRMKKSCLAAGFTRVDVRYRIFFPRALAKLRVLEPYMTALPLGAQFAIYASKS